MPSWIARTALIAVLAVNLLWVAFACRAARFWARFCARVGGNVGMSVVVLTLVCPASLRSVSV